MTDRPAIPALTGLRFVAAFAIVINHLGPNITKLNGESLFMGNFQRLAFLGMTTFFVLSGFIIHYNYGHKIASFSPRAIWNFAVARFARLYPLFFFVVLGDLAIGNFFLYAETRTADIMVGMLPRVLSGTHSWTYSFYEGYFTSTPFGVSVVTWSISTEFFLYACYPFIAFWLLKIRRPAVILPLTLLVCALSIFVVYLVRSNAAAIDLMAFETFGIVSHPKEPFSNWLWYLSPYGRLPEFISGCFIAQLHLALAARPIGKRESAIASVVAFGAVAYVGLHLAPEFLSLHVPFPTFTYWTGMGPALMFLVFYVARYRGFITRALQTRFVMLFGETSYSIYMLHMVIVTLVAMPAPLAFTETRFVALVGRGFFACAIVLLLSLATYLVVENPARRWVSRKLTIAVSGPANAGQARPPGY